MENQTQDTTQEITTDAPAAPELSINDLQSLRAIVDLAAKRGAFLAGEMSAVGATFDRLNTFLTAVLPKPTEEVAAPEAEQAAEA